MSTVRTFPCTLTGVGIRLVKHADDKMTLQAHRRLALNPFAVNNFGHFSKALSFRRANLELFMNTGRLGFRRLKSQNRTIVDDFPVRIPDHQCLSY